MPFQRLLNGLKRTVMGTSGNGGGRDEPPTTTSKTSATSLSNQMKLTRPSKIMENTPASPSPPTAGVPMPVLMPKIEPGSRPIVPITRDPRQKMVSTSSAREPVEHDSNSPSPGSPYSECVETEIDIKTETFNSEDVAGPSGDSTAWVDKYLDQTPSLKIPDQPVRIKQEPVDEDEQLMPEPPSPPRPPTADYDGDSSATEGLPSPAPPPDEDATEYPQQEEPIEEEMKPAISDREPPSAASQPSTASKLYSRALDVDELFQDEDAREEGEEVKSPHCQYSQNEDMDEEAETSALLPVAAAVLPFPNGSEFDHQPDEFDAEASDDDEDPAWCYEPSSEAPQEDERAPSSAGQKRSHPEDGESEVQQLTKKSRFLIISTKEPLAPQEETPPANSSSQPRAAEAGGSAAARSNRIPVKLTPKNRASMMIEDYLEADKKATGAPPPSRKRPSTPNKKRKRQVSGGVDSAPPSPTLPDIVDQPPGSNPLRNDVQAHHQQQMTLTLPNGRRVDPRLKMAASEPIKVPLSTSLKLELLQRILHWRFKWFEEQKQFKKPPPLLDGTKDLVPEWNCVPLLTIRYPDVQSYFKILHPLMLHELWSSLSQEYLDNQRAVSWNILIKTADETEKELGFALLNGAIVMDHVAEAPKLDELVVFSFHRKEGQEVFVFGHVHSCRAYQVGKTNRLDTRLTPKGRPRVAADVVIRICWKYLPGRNPDSVYTMTRVASIATFLAQLHAQAVLAENFAPNAISLTMSPMINVILNPSRPVFDLIGFAGMKLEMLDPPQTTALFSIAQTILITPAHEPKIALINAPPGTGKSEVLMYVIRHLMSHKVDNARHRVLYCAPNEATVDEAVCRLLAIRMNCAQGDRFHVIRLGGRPKRLPPDQDVSVETLSQRWLLNIKQEKPPMPTEPTDPSVHGNCSDNRPSYTIRRIQEQLNVLESRKVIIQNEIDSGEADLQGPGRRLVLEKELAELEKELTESETSLEEARRDQTEEQAAEALAARHRIISDADVICTTLDDCLHPDLEALFVQRKPGPNGKVARPFLCCVIDDASQCTEPQSLMPLGLGIRKLIMAGDSEQLPIHLTSDVGKEHRFTQSLFSRLLAFCEDSAGSNTQASSNSWPNPVFQLNTQYRMDQEICRWPSNYFYGGRLLTDPKVDYSQKTILHAYRVLDVRDGQESKESRQIVNHQEATVVANLVGEILSNGELVNKKVAVITFFPRQCQVIQQAIQERCPTEHKRVAVGLPEKFNGAEKDIVIVSFVKVDVSSKKKSFKPITEKLNLALTRAAESLYICAHIATLVAHREENDALYELAIDADRRQVISRITSVFHPTLLFDIILKPDYGDSDMS